MTGDELKARTEAFFKEVLPEMVVSLINGETVLAANLERVTEGIEIGPPARARVPLRIGRNPGVGARGFKEALPAAGNSKYTSTYIDLAYNYAVFYVPGQYFKAKTKEASFGSYLTEETESTIEGAKLDYNRQLIGDGTGVLADCGVMGAPGADIPVSDTKWFYEDQVVDVLVKATGVVLAENYVVVSIDPVGGDVTLNDDAGNPANIQTNATHAFYTASTRNKEINGLQAINSDANPPRGPLQDIDPANVAIWKAQVTPAAANPLSEELLEEHLDAIQSRTRTGNNRKLIITTFASRRKIAQSIRSDRQITGDTQTLKGGFKAVWWNDNPIVAERDQADGRCDVVDLKYTKEWMMSDWDTMDQGGSRLIPDPNGTDGYVVRLFKYSQAATTHRATGGPITGLTE